MRIYLFICLFFSKVFPCSQVAVARYDGVTLSKLSLTSDPDTVYAEVLDGDAVDCRVVFKRDGTTVRGTKKFTIFTSLDCAQWSKEIVATAPTLVDGSSLLANRKAKQFETLPVTNRTLVIGDTALSLPATLASETELVTVHSATAAVVVLEDVLHRFDFATPTAAPQIVEVPFDFGQPSFDLENDVLVLDQGGGSCVGAYYYFIDWSNSTSHKLYGLFDERTGMSYDVSSYSDHEVCGETGTCSDGKLYLTGSTGTASWTSDDVCGASTLGAMSSWGLWLCTVAAALSLLGNK